MRPTRQVDLERIVAGGEDDALLQSLISQHRRWTGSKKAAALLADWSAARSSFFKARRRPLCVRSVSALCPLCVRSVSALATPSPPFSRRAARVMGFFDRMLRVIISVSLDLISESHKCWSIVCTKIRVYQHHPQYYGTQ